MTWFALLLAFLIETWRPHAFGAKAQALWSGWVQVGSRLVTGKPGLGPVVVAVLAVTLPAVLVAGVHALLQRGLPLLGWMFEVAVLVACLGAQAVRARFLAVRDALERDDLDRASSLLAEWVGQPVGERVGPRAFEGVVGQVASVDRDDVVRQLARHALVQAHRQVLGVMFAFIALAALGFGPAGAVLYRLACVQGSSARADDEAPRTDATSDHAAAARAVLDAVDQVPARLTAVGFAVVGHFDHAITAWRRDRALWDDTAAGIVLAAASGAAGVDLHPQPAPSPVETASPGPSAPSRALPVSALDTLASLVSRSVLLWMLLLALLTLANVIG